MIIYPDIEIQGGKCVNLLRGQMDQPKVYDVTPLQAAKNFESQGAEWLHIVDLDAVSAGGGDANSEQICEIIEAVNVPVQVGGGIRNLYSVEWWLDRGAARVVIGTAAVKDPTFVREACSQFPGKVVISVDAQGDKVMVEGWRETTAFTPLEFARQFETLDLAGMIFTDIDFDDKLPESRLAATTEMATELILPVIVSGTIRTLDDVSTLQYLPNIAGAISGRALFEGDMALPEAIEVARAQDRVPGFV